MVSAAALTVALSSSSIFGQTSWNNTTGGDWSDPLNWTSGIPTASDDVTIGGTDTFTVNLDTNGTLAELIFTNANASLRIGADGTSRLLTIGADSTVDGTIILDASTSFGATLSRTGDITLNGALAFTGGGTGQRSFNSGLVNNGVVNVDADAQFNRSSSTITNNGTFNVAAGKSVGFGSSVTFAQNSGSLNVLGDFTMNGDTFIYNGGTISGDINLTGSNLTIGAGTSAATFHMMGTGQFTGDVLAGQVLNVASSTASTNTLAQGDFSNSGTINVTADGIFSSTLTRIGTITNEAGGVMNFGGAGTGNKVLNASLTNHGTVNLNETANFTRSSGVITNHGDFNIAAGKAINFGSGSSFTQQAGTLNVMGDFTMNADTFVYNGGAILGDINLISSNLTVGAGTSAATFNMSGTGQFTGDVLAGQVLNVASSTASTNTLAQGDFSNSGTINVVADGNFSATLTRIGTVTNEAAGVMNFDGVGSGNKVLNASLTNHGTVNLNETANFTRSSATTTNHGDFNIAAGKAINFGSGSIFIQQAGTLNVMGDFTMTSDSFEYNGGAINGDINLVASNLTIGAGGTGAATFNMQATGQFTGNLSAGQVFNVKSDGASTQTIAQADFSNAGTINVIAETAFSSTLSRTGTITNAVGGIINSTGAGDGARQISASLVNNGTVNANESLQFSRSSSTISNNGNFNVGNGSQVSFGSSVTFVQQGGTLNNGNGGTFAMNSDNFEFTGGTIVGAIDLASSNLTIGAGAGAGTFNATGFGTLTGDVQALQTINIDSGPAAAQLLVQADINNQGTINIDASSGFAATLTRTTGSITNSGVVNFTGGGAGARRLSTSVVNLGEIHGFSSSTFGASGSTHSNLGEITNHAGATMTFDGISFTNEAAGLLAGVGEMDFESVTVGLTNNGRIGPGFSAGTLTLDGDIVFGSTSSLEIEIGGLNQGSEYDLLVGLDTLTLGGGLDIRFLNGFQNAAAGNTFDIVTANSLVGTFASLADGATVDTADGFGTFQINYVGNTVRLSNFQFTAVPEPGFIAWVGLALPVVMLRHRRSTARNKA